MSDAGGQSNRGETLFWAGVSAAIIAMLLWAYTLRTGAEAVTPAADFAGFECRPIPDGYEFTGTELRKIEASTPIVEVSTPEPVIPDWQQQFMAALPGLGLPWMGLDVKGARAALIGNAPSEEERTYGFEIGRELLLDNEAADPPITQVENRIQVAGRKPWVGPLVDSFKSLNLPWMDLAVNGEVATITGTAPSVEEKERGFRLGKLALEGSPDARSQIALIVDGISVEGGERAAGEALAQLAVSSAETGPDLEGCRTAFQETMNGRNIQFEVNRDIINLDSARLLDALTGVAILCTGRGGYNVEIGGHTDVRGSAAYNERLSQDRANAVRQYLIDKGVASEKLTAIGYGEQRPLDREMTDEAHAINRRTEFLVTQAR